MGKRKKILVLGDSCIDVFIYGDVSNQGIDYQIFSPLSETINEGMALNVYNNIKPFNVEHKIITNKKKPIKTRYIDKKTSNIILRVDKDDNIKQNDKLKLKSIKFEKYDAIIISDYNKGFLHENQIEYIAKNHPLVFMDSKKKLGKWCENIACIKINQKEYNENKDYLNKEYKNHLIVTLAENGAMLNHNEKVFKVKQNNKVNSCGAGDTFLASLVVEFLNTNNIIKSIEFANKCASWVITQQGVSIIKNIR